MDYSLSPSLGPRYLNITHEKILFINDENALEQRNDDTVSIVMDFVFGIVLSMLSIYSLVAIYIVCCICSACILSVKRSRVDPEYRV